jgi:hypothetical protein
MALKFPKFSKGKNISVLKVNSNWGKNIFIFQGPKIFVHCVLS